GQAPAAPQGCVEANVCDETVTGGRGVGTAPASPAASGFTPGRNLASIRYRARCATNRSFASRIKESGSREKRLTVASTRVPRDRPSKYQSTSAPRVAPIAATIARTRFIRPEPDRAPAPTSIGTAGKWHPGLHGKRPDKEHHHAVLDESVRHRRYIRIC